MKLDAIAKQLKELDRNIILIFAFNATGKTRLCVAYKDATKDLGTDKHTGVYYNAFSEDLFFWNNDEENDCVDVRLTVRQSSLSRLHSFLSEEAVFDKLAMYFPTYRFKFNMHENAETGIESITFFTPDAEDRPIKISRGEERIFVWCFFLALLGIEGWADQQNAHIFIDDPVSSLDDHNIFVTADSIFQLIEAHSLEKRIIVTTHHIGLFAILVDRLTKGEKAGRYKNLTKVFILSNKAEDFSLEDPNSDVFLYHLHLLKEQSDFPRGIPHQPVRYTRPLLLV